MLSTVKEVIDAVGGPSAACSIAGIKSETAPFNWIERGRIPPAHSLVFADALRAAGKQADPAVFGLTQTAEARQ